VVTISVLGGIGTAKGIKATRLPQNEHKAASQSLALVDELISSRPLPRLRPKAPFSRNRATAFACCSALGT
jgi:hypothetical protein